MLTIEEDLLEALSKAGAFPEEMKDNLGKVRSDCNCKIVHVD